MKNITYEIELRDKITGKWQSWETHDTEPSNDYCEDLLDSSPCRSRFNSYKIAKVESSYKTPLLISMSGL